MAALWATLLLTAFWGAYDLPPAGLGTILAPTPAPAPHETETTPPGQETEITEANWQRHPKIKAIRQIVSSINAGLKRGMFKTSERRGEFCNSDQYFVLRRIARDSKGAVTWYEHYSEGQDASWDFHYYYDRAGRLRFVFALARSANGTREQLRIYFDEKGKRLWKTDKLLKGFGCPGCFHAYYDSDEGLAFDPAKEFASDEGCKEIKPKARARPQAKPSQ